MDLSQIALAVALVGFAGTLVWLARVLPHKTELPEPVFDPEILIKGLEPVVRQMAQIELDHAALRLAVADGIARVDRADKRIQKTVASARRLVRDNGLEHPGVEAEYEELRGGDGEAGEEEQPNVQRVPEGLAVYPPTGIPGVDWAQLQELNQRIRGDA